MSKPSKNKHGNLKPLLAIIGLGPLLLQGTRAQSLLGCGGFEFCCATRCGQRLHVPHSGPKPRYCMENRETSKSNVENWAVLLRLAFGNAQPSSHATAGFASDSARQITKFLERKTFPRKEKQMFRRIRNNMLKRPLIVFISWATKRDSEFFDSENSWSCRDEVPEPRFFSWRPGKPRKLTSSAELICKATRLETHSPATPAPTPVTPGAPQEQASDRFRTSDQKLLRTEDYPREKTNIIQWHKWGQTFDLDINLAMSVKLQRSLCILTYLPHEAVAEVSKN